MFIEIRDMLNKYRDLVGGEIKIRINEVLVKLRKSRRMRKKNKENKKKEKIIHLIKRLFYVFMKG
jgi:hypothetical protein